MEGTLDSSDTSISKSIRLVSVLKAWALVAAPLTAYASEPIKLDVVDVTARPDTEESTDSSLGAERIETKSSDARRRATGDTADLLRETPGVSLYGAGGISSLPGIHGLADDRVRVQVDGIELMPGCPNHMNAPLSYVAPSMVRRITVFSGLTPVSVGGDSLGGTIQIESPAPRFAELERSYLATGELGGFYRSNGNAVGYHLSASGALGWIHLTYREANSWSGNYSAGEAFKDATSGLRANEVGSSAYRAAANRSVRIALRHEQHLLQLDLARQTMDFEGFPNQRMDMTSNDNLMFAARYSLQAEWGDLKTQVGYQHTDHAMDMGADRFSYGSGMPMQTEQKTWSASAQGNLLLSEQHTMRTGVEFQRHVLHDWWPPVGGAMGPNTFWNVDYGRRQRIGGFAELESQWSARWTSQIGMRHDRVLSDAAAVQGYDNGLGGLWGADAVAFNSVAHDRADVNWDISAVLHHVPTAGLDIDFGYARKSHSPNLYHRYPWATNAMAALMNNFVGDGNGYIGRIDLRPEVAHTVSATTRVRDREEERWELKVRGYYTYIHRYIDAIRCDFGQCGAANATSETGFVLLQYTNQRAELFGGEVRGRVSLARLEQFGEFRLTGIANYVRGTNRSTGEGLYAIMPLSGKVAIDHRLGGWHGSLEIFAVAPKSRVSHVRNEVSTGGYELLTLRGGYEWAHVRMDIALENLLNRLYFDPLGGAYVGEGATMTTRGVPWGIAVPGRGRSLNLTFTASY